MQKSDIREMDTESVTENETPLHDNIEARINCEEKERMGVEVELQNDVKTANLHPRLEALIIPTRSRIMECRNVGAFVDADALTAVLVRPAMNPKQPNHPKTISTRKLKREHSVRDYTTFCDGIKLEETLRYVEHFRTATSVSEAAVERAVLEAETDINLLDCEFGSETWVTPTAKQVSVYYELCSTCKEMGIDYNHRDFPETEREYRLAISSLSRAIKHKTARHIRPICIHNLN